MKKNWFLPLLLALALILPGTAMALDDPNPAATAVILVDGDNREVLYGLNMHEHRFPASITKVMTALLVLEDVERGLLNLDQVIVASETYRTGLSADGSTQNIRPGEELTVRELLYCTLVASANEACNILAEAASGSVSAFVDRMNDRARELGMENTHFANTHGLHNANHYTTAYDIWLMCEEAMTHRLFREISSAVSHTVPATNLSKERTFYSTNALLTAYRYPGYTYRYAIGIKTGSTPEAGQCLVSAAVKNKRTFYCVILGAENVTREDKTIDRQSFSESSRLLEWGFQNFSRKTILNAAEPQAEMPVELSQKVSYVALKPAVSLEATLANDIDIEALVFDSVLFYDAVDAPVAEGAVLGRITVSSEDGEIIYGEVDLIAVNAVERSELLYRMRQIREFFSNKYVIYALAGLLVLIIILYLRLRVFASRKRRNRRNYRYRR